MPSFDRSASYKIVTALAKAIEIQKEIDGLYGEVERSLI